MAYSIIAGIHAVAEALRAHERGTRALERIHLIRGASTPRLLELAGKARQLGVAVRSEDRAALDRLAGGVHQGIAAVIEPVRYAALEDLLSKRAAPLVILDGVEDPHNLGAVIRTAHAAGAGAVIVPDRRAAGITPAVSKAAAGALEHLPVARVTNINRALEAAKQAGYWVYGLDERGEQAHYGLEYSDPCVFVLGGEGKGIHQQTRRHCDVLVRIPLAGEISSLNVSVAAGIALFEWKRRRDMGQAGRAGGQSLLPNSW
jgi:23S rRNA (guanosine2251-2'-O)-methyltransferase